MKTIIIYQEEDILQMFADKHNVDTNAITIKRVSKTIGYGMSEQTVEELEIEVNESKTEEIK